ncbi:sigma-70 family RNA polymerase sigma factor [Alicyclobacillus macrosporangiidus]|uniref:RNA polymerase sigma-70 factor, ECF subfamily n=1 Tax=Alicyclobacillus macrosporangiidus TaxID=392015 RepID=A0A1I7LJJ5_9BACL|nr:sigma-70 family RNA polymerase sigma factor [Alicyclobacillus macrosporangiidus]SFV09800.1 RNA polymerase sigma-70 factor, ECF subfamily [Alicyclobacillus macrosporangiidus]
MESVQTASRELRKEFENLIVAFRPELWNYCLYLTRSPWDAEDLVQETIVKTFAHMAHLYQVVNMRAYLFRMASNLWIDWCRRARLVSQDDRFLRAIPAPDEVDRADVIGSMEDLIRLLPPRQRVILLLMDVFDFSARETAEMLVITEGAVKAALHRARRTLQGNRACAPVGRAVKKVPPAVVNAYLEAFNKRDADGIAALLDEHAVADIVGVTQEYGRDTIRKNSLSDWAQDPIPMRGAYFDWDSTSFIGVFAMENGEEKLDTIIRVTEDGERIRGVADYYFCPELLQHVASQLHVSARARGYFWNT